MNKITISSLEIQHVQQQIQEYLQKHWRLFLAEGILFMLLGLAAIAIPQLFSVAIILFLGWIFLFGGVAQIARAIKFSAMPGFGLWLFIGVIQAILGYWFIAQPISGIFTVTLLMTLFFAFEGMAKISLALMMRPLANWGFILFSGCTALIFSLVIWMGWPGTAEWLLGLFLGINMLLLGWSMVNISLHHKDNV
ncbi:MAG: DUF308 domain-containing protein [Methylococcales bacterium]|nr:DUF308 domain-containing protein [Methylococcales bacterium]